MQKDKVLILSILDDISTIKSFANGYDKEKFFNDKLVRAGICMYLIEIGESVKNLSANMRGKFSNIPWKKISGLRDIAAHKYGTINFDIVWDVVQIDLPELEISLNKMVLTIY